MRKGCGHAGNEPGCSICRVFATDPRYARALAGARGTPASAPAPVCVYLGASLTGRERATAGLSHGRDWRFCLHAEQPLGPHVCRCQGCGPSCRGYQAGEGEVEADADSASWPLLTHRQAHQPEQIVRHAAALRGLLGRSWEYPGGAGDGVILIGGGKYWPGIVVALRMLRASGSQLPVEVWYRGAAEPVVPADIEDVPGVTLIDATQVGSPRILGGWECKAHALQHTTFARVLYLDADCYPVCDPEHLFRLLDDVPFVFWTDLPHTVKNVKWQRLGVEAGTVGPIQGGQLLFDRKACWRELCIAHWMNQHSDFYYQHVFGDQDCWRASWTMTGGRHLNLGPATWERIAFVCRYKGQPCCVHRCQSKMFVGEEVKSALTLPREEEAWGYFWECVGKRNAGKSAAEVFGDLYERRIWGAGSGGGGDPAKMEPYLRLVGALTRVMAAQRVVDVGAGDGRILDALRERCPGVAFTGVDCLPLRPEYVVADALDVDALPAGDLLLCKDAAHHWPNEMVVRFIDAVLAARKWRWALFAQDVHQQHEKQDTCLGGYRPLHPALPPLRDYPFTVAAEWDVKCALLLDCGGAADPSLPPATRRR